MKRDDETACFLPAAAVTCRLNFNFFYGRNASYLSSPLNRKDQTLTQYRSLASEFLATMDTGQDWQGTNHRPSSCVRCLFAKPTPLFSCIPETSFPKQLQDLMTLRFPSVIDYC